MGYRKEIGWCPLTHATAEILIYFIGGMSGAFCWSKIDLPYLRFTIFNLIASILAAILVTVITLLEKGSS